jgi:hypothetical protein
VANERVPKGALSPLWIIGLFVSIVEIVITVAIIQTAGGVQGWLTAFAIAFAFYIATAFFIILWRKNHVFYGPSEFDQQDPSKFVTGMQSATRNGDELARIIRDAVENAFESEELITALEITGDRAHTSQILQNAAEKTIDDINEKASIAIVISEESYHIRHFLPLRIFIAPGMTLYDIVNEISAANSHSLSLPIEEYGTRWFLRIKTNPKNFLLPDSSFDWPMSPRLRTATIGTLLRYSLDDLKIEPGMTLEVVHNKRAIPAFA